MTVDLIPLKPARVAEMVRDGRAVLIDIREPAEFNGARADGAVSHPLSTFGRSPISVGPGQEVIFTCRSGMRTANYCRELKSAVDGPAYVLEGGLDAWAAAGLPVERGAGRG